MVSLTTKQPNIQLASQSEQALEEISTFLNDLGNKLVLFDIYKDNMQLNSEILENFFNLLVDLVLNCVSAIKHFRKNDMMNAVKLLAWKNIDARFRKIIRDLDSKIDHLRNTQDTQTRRFAREHIDREAHPESTMLRFGIMRDLVGGKSQIKSFK